MPESKAVATYPTEEQHAWWEQRAEEMDMSMSEFVQSMTEAGMKKFEVRVQPDETNRELREQRNDLRDELEQARERIRNLEDRLHGGERRDIVEYVEENPGVEYDQIIQRISETAPARVSEHLTDLEGEELTVENGEYYLQDEATDV